MAPRPDAPARAAGRGRLWLAGLALGLLLAPGISLSETPPLESLEGYASSGRLGLGERPARVTLYLPGRDGLYYPTHELGTLLSGLPFAHAARALSDATGLPFRELLQLLLSWFSAALFATTLVALVAAARRAGPAPHGEATLLLVLLASSGYLVHAVQPSDVSQAATVFALTCLAWLAAGTGRPAALLWLGLGCGVLVLLKVTHLTILAAACLVTASEGAVPVRTRAARVLLILAGALPGLALAAWWNVLRLGTPLATPYPAISTRFQLETVPASLAGALLSPGKGLFVYTPVLLLLPAAIGALSRDRSRRRDVAWILGSLAATLLFLSGTEAWSGRSGWGIRYYVTWLPPLLLLLALGEWRRPAARGRAWLRGGLLATGLVVNLAGVVTNSHYRQGLCGFEPWRLRGMPACAVAALPGNLARALGAPLADTVLPRASPDNVWVSNRLAVWWFAARLRGLPRAASWAVAAGLGLVAVAAWRSGTRARQDAAR